MLAKSGKSSPSGNTLQVVRRFSLNLQYNLLRIRFLSLSGYFS